MKPRFKVLPDPAPDPDRDVQYNEVTGMITIQGETLEMLTELAKAAGMSKGRYLNMQLRELMQDPLWLQKLVIKHRPKARGKFHSAAVVIAAHEFILSRRLK